MLLSYSRRLHRSYIINVHHVDLYIKGENPSIVMTNGFTIVISRRKKDELLVLLNQNVTDLAQLKWVFDGKKMTQEQLSASIKKVIEEWNVPVDVLRHWGYDASDAIKFKNNVLLPNIEIIFTVQ